MSANNIGPVGTKPTTAKQGPCYHCEFDAGTNRFCDTWKVWSCNGCHEKHHRPHHSPCNSLIPRGPEAKLARPAAVNQWFTVWLTLYDGRRSSMRCRLGEKLQMEDHWMGTYIFVTSGMVLVLEDRATINERIIAGLASLQ